MRLLSLLCPDRNFTVKENEMIGLFTTNMESDNETLIKDEVDMIYLFHCIVRAWVSCACMRLIQGRVLMLCSFSCISHEMCSFQIGVFT